MNDDKSKRRRFNVIDTRLIKEYGDCLNSDDLNELCRELDRWHFYQDTDYLDAAVSFLHDKKVPIKGVLLDEVGKIAKARLNRDVTESTNQRRDERPEYLKQAKGKMKSEPHELANYIVFTLIEICEMKTEESYRYASKILHRDHSDYFRAMRDKLDIPVKVDLSDRTIRRNYEEFKNEKHCKTMGEGFPSMYKTFKENLDLFKEEFYPGVTPEEIKSKLIQCLRDFEP